MTEPRQRFEDPELLEEFLAEARVYLGRIASAAELLESGQPAAAGDLARAGHSLRGAAAALGLHELADGATAIEALGEALATGRLAWRSEAADRLLPLVSGAAAYLDEFGVGLQHHPDPSSLLLLASQLDALAHEDDAQDEISELLREEARDCLEQMGRHLQQLRGEPLRRDLLESVRRPVHTLKGAAATAGFRQVSDLAHRLEDLLELEAAQPGAVTEERIDLILEVSDALEDLLRVGSSASPSTRIESLERRLEAAVHGTTASLVEAQQESLEPPPYTPGAAVVTPGYKTREAADLPSPREEAFRNPDESSTAADRLLRVSAQSLDESLRVAGESLVHRSTFDRHFATLREAEQELSSAVERMNRLAQRLATEYEARTLMDFPAARPINTSPEEFDSLELDRYTELHLISRELAEAVSDVGAVAGTLSDAVIHFDGFHDRMGRLLLEVQERLGRLRLVPFSTLQGRLFRTVRAAEGATGKRADLTLDATGVELEKNVLEELSEPLLHVLRNAVDHGIEAPQQRRAAGKSERGTIRISATYQGTEVVVVVEDDGRGLDLEGLKADAVTRGLLAPEVAASLSSEEAASLAFLPRVSTASQVSQLSGRGVGLEVMKAVADRLRGSATLVSRPGLGLRLEVRLPMTLASLRAVFVEVRGQIFALPQTAVLRIHRLTEADIHRHGEQPVILSAGETVPVLELGAHLKLPGDETPQWPRPVLVVDTDQGAQALVVDRLAGSADIVLKALGPLLRSYRGFMGATLSSDGSVILMLDPRDLLQHRPLAPMLEEPAIRVAARALRVLVVDDSLTVRRILTRLIEARGWQAQAARDGLEALELVQGGLAPDVVLMDIEMPRMDGYELTALLRSDARHRDIPIIMLTSRAGQKHRLKAAELGVEAYLVKPYDEATLVSTVRQVTSWKEA